MNVTAKPVRPRQHQAQSAVRHLGRPPGDEAKTQPTAKAYLCAAAPAPGGNWRLRQILRMVNGLNQVSSMPKLDAGNLNQDDVASAPQCEVPSDLSKEDALRI